MSFSENRFPLFRDMLSAKLLKMQET